MHSVNGRRQPASPSPTADTEGVYDPADDLDGAPATLGHLRALRAYLEGTPEQPPCWCPDAPGRHLDNCHVDALLWFARQWTCRAGGGAFIGNGQAFDCTCPTCRIEAAIGAIGNRIVDAIRNLDFGDVNMDMNITEGKGKPGEELVDGPEAELDLKERRRLIIKALEQYGSGQGEDGKWNCAHPDHEDVNPSMSVLWDNETGKISFKCWSCGPPDGTPEKRRWTSKCLKELGLSWSVMFPRRKTGEGHEPPF
jgi:hypothetical protein